MCMCVHCASHFQCGMRHWHTNWKYQRWKRNVPIIPSAWISCWTNILAKWFRIVLCNHALKSMPCKMFYCIVQPPYRPLNRLLLWIILIFICVLQKHMYSQPLTHHIQSDIVLLPAFFSLIHSFNFLLLLCVVKWKGKERKDERNIYLKISC